ncbi:MAG: carboxypeptidase-like regulatory domain-containing protein [Bacteroidales bacterium]|nr:carboxypeptidase-like regulatory domain-containing protein [Bacteroidales bacterium]MCF8386282.1 carboxypeptidase-like regulatory domain-containing protein [Bacteroidales bacterium]MCF8397535.1 carboxypeptidase-like regulatory domain-containing protein [Bacteroidales bacterium]
MMKSVLMIMLFVLPLISMTQELNQTVRGTIVDQFSKEPLPGANIILPGSEPLRGTTSDVEGKFRLDKVPVGRINLKISYLGYNDVSLNNLPLTSGKELVLHIQMEEMAIQAEEVEIKARVDKTRSLNKMATVSSRSFSVEESQRYAGSRNDVARMAANYAGVWGIDDSRNDIIIRGNSPIGLLWRLEGVDIPNPNHYGAMGTTGGPVSILNNNLLANSDFMTGAFPAEYGNAIAGVFDLNMRSGNNEQHEFLGQVGFNGFELGAEGPISKENGSSYLLNYRYSTLELFDLLGMNFGTGTAVPKYQDLSFKINLPNTKLGNFSVFGIGGISDIAFLDSEKDTTENKLDFYGGEGLDLTNGSDMGAIGITHTLNINKSSYTRFVVSGTYHKFQTQVDSIIPSTHDIVPKYRNDFTQVKLFSSLEYNKKINARHNYTVGANINQLNFDLVDSAYNENVDRFNIITDYQGSTYLLQTYFQWQYKITNEITLNPGIHWQYFGLNGSSNLEPRLGFQWQYATDRSISLAYGYHSQLMPITTYFNQEQLPDGSYVKPNKSLDLLKSHHFVVAHDWRISQNIRLKTEVYYQKITDAAVNASKEDSYSVLNQGANFYIATPDSLVNKGTGENYGVDITFEKFISNGLYYLLTASVYESKYKGSDAVERNTAFNGAYVINALLGKDFDMNKVFTKSKKNNTLNIDIKSVWAGGQRYTPINVEESLKENHTVYYDDLAYSRQFKDYFRTDFRIAFRQDAKNLTMEWAIDFQNIFNTRNIYSRQFNTKTGEISEIDQLGLLVVPQFRIEF